MKPLETQLAELQAELKTHFATAAEQQTKHGTMTTELKTQIEALQKQADALDAKLVTRDIAAEPISTLDKEFKENENIARLMRDKRGSAVITLTGKSAQELFERKTTITSAAVGAATTGVLQIDRIPGITIEARQVLRVRDLFTARPTQMQVIDFVKVLSPLSQASPVSEGNVKLENALTFQSASERVKTIATWIPASRQIMDDFAELRGFIDTSLPYYVNLAEEVQLLSGDATGENLHGIIPQATAFNAGLLVAAAGWNKIDIIGRAIQQITAAKELDPTFVILHPNDWWSIRLTKDGFGRYILGDPQAPSSGGTQNTAVRPNIFGLDVVHTTSITTGTFLVGSGNPIANEIRDRMEVQVEISTEHSDFFTRNLVAVRAEKRLAQITKRPASFVTGTFTTSP